MRILNSSIIVLGLASLSCSGFGGWTAPSATAVRVATAAPDDAWSSRAGPHAENGLLVEDAEPVRIDRDRFAAVSAHAMERRIRAEIHAELDARHTGLSDRELALLADTIVDESERYGLDPSLTLAVIRVESGGYHLAVSPVGALGLMQLLPSTAEELAMKHGLAWRGPNSLFDPILNVKLGTAYLSQLEQKYGSMNTALAAYNWGPGRIDRRLRRGASVPRVYPEQVMKFYEAGARPAGPASRS